MLVIQHVQCLKNKVLSFLTMLPELMTPEATVASERLGATFLVSEYGQWMK